MASRPGAVEQVHAPERPALAPRPRGGQGRRLDRELCHDPPDRSGGGGEPARDCGARAPALWPRNPGARDRPPRLRAGRPERPRPSAGPHALGAAHQGTPGALRPQPLHRPAHQRPPPAQRRAEHGRGLPDPGRRRGQPAVDPLHAHVRNPVEPPARDAGPDRHPRRDRRRCAAGRAADPRLRPRLAGWRGPLCGAVPALPAGRRRQGHAADAQGLARHAECRGRRAAARPDRDRSRRA